MHSFQEYRIILTATALREGGKADSSASPVLPTAPAVLLQLNVPRNHLCLPFPSPQGEEPAGLHSYFCFFFSTKPFLTCTAYTLEETNGGLET